MPKILTVAAGVSHEAPSAAEKAEKAIQQATYQGAANATSTGSSTSLPLTNVDLNTPDTNANANVNPVAEALKEQVEEIRRADRIKKWKVKKINKIKRSMITREQIIEDRKKRKAEKVQQRQKNRDIQKQLSIMKMQEVEYHKPQLSKEAEEFQAGIPEALLAKATPSYRLPDMVKLRLKNQLAKNSSQIIAPTGPRLPDLSRFFTMAFEVQTMILENLLVQPFPITLAWHKRIWRRRRGLFSATKYLYEICRAIYYSKNEFQVSIREFEYEPSKYEGMG
jgi:hypothetical protein